MAGTAIGGELRVENASGIRFSVATEADDGEIRRLLRENPMAGRIRLSFEREPSYFREETAEAVQTKGPTTTIPLKGDVNEMMAETPCLDDADSESAPSRQTILARECERVVCVGSCSYRRRFVNGQARRVGYLGGLRLDGKVAGRFDILRRGYQYFRDLKENAGADLYFTSIAADNERAIRFLERGLPGMPRYEYLGGFVTVLVPVPRQRRTGMREGLARAEGHESQVTALSACLKAHNRHYQLAPCWTAEELLALGPLGLSLDDFRVVREGNKIIGCAALWDQRSFKQTVIRGYSGPLSWGRPWLNAAARLAGRPRLPAVKTTLAQAAVSHLAVDPNQPALLIGLIHSLFPIAQEKGIELLTLGFNANDPRLETIQKNFFSHEYRTRLYTVRWQDSDFEFRDSFDLRSRPAGTFRFLLPELALL